MTDRDRGWRGLFARVDAMRGESFVKVGVLADSDKGGLHVRGGSLTVAEIAAVQEFGTQDGRIPSRSFVRATFDEAREELEQLAVVLLAKIIFDGMPADQAFGLLGLKLASAMKRKITDGDGIPPPNAPSTIAAKGSSRPLVDTGRLLGAIGWAVVRRGEQGESKYAGRSA